MTPAELLERVQELRKLMEGQEVFSLRPCQGSDWCGQYGDPPSRCDVCADRERAYRRLVSAAMNLLPDLLAIAESYIRSQMEQITGPAIRHYAGEVFYAAIPASHHTVSELIQSRVPAALPLKWEQGFMTSTGRYVDRAEGKSIARAAGQIVNPISGTDELFSEELWVPTIRGGPVLRRRGSSTLARPAEDFRRRRADFTSDAADIADPHAREGELT